MQRSSVPAPPRRLVIATANPGKLREFRALLEGLPFEPVSLAELDLPSPEETGTSFLENAVLKARHAAVLSGGAAVADDSGLEVDALGGAPGIYSARFAGASADDAANNAKLVAQLRGVPDSARTARYRCALVFVDSAHAAPLIAEGVWEGRILGAPRGLGGFGYDPYFWLPAFNMTAAELDADDKNRWSHRGVAMRSLREHLKAHEALAPREPLP
jgi:XTP/dITP diphosphohydrolase